MEKKRGSQRGLGADQGDKRKGRGIGQVTDRQLPRGSLMGQEEERHAEKPRGTKAGRGAGRGPGQRAGRGAERPRVTEVR